MKKIKVTLSDGRSNIVEVPAELTQEQVIEQLQPNIPQGTSIESMSVVMSPEERVAWAAEESRLLPERIEQEKQRVSYQDFKEKTGLPGVIGMNVLAPLTTSAWEKGELGGGDIAGDIALSGLGLIPGGKVVGQGLIRGGAKIAGQELVKGTAAEGISSLAQDRDFDLMNAGISAGVGGVIQGGTGLARNAFRKGLPTIPGRLPGKPAVQNTVIDEMVNSIPAKKMNPEGWKEVLSKEIRDLVPENVPVGEEFREQLKDKIRKKVSAEFRSGRISSREEMSKMISDGIKSVDDIFKGRGVRGGLAKQTFSNLLDAPQTPENVRNRALELAVSPPSRDASNVTRALTYSGMDKYIPSELPFFLKPSVPIGIEQTLQPLAMQYRLPAYLENLTD